jgi:hypothetical protein
MRFRGSANKAIIGKCITSAGCRIFEQDFPECPCTEQRQKRATSIPTRTVTAKPRRIGLVPLTSVFWLCEGKSQADIEMQGFAQPEFVENRCVKSDLGK